MREVLLMWLIASQRRETQHRVSLSIIAYKAKLVIIFLLIMLPHGKVNSPVLVTWYLSTVECENRISEPSHITARIKSLIKCLVAPGRANVRTGTLPLPQQGTHSPVQVPSRLKWVSGHWERHCPASSTRADPQAVQLWGVFPAHMRQDGWQAGKKNRRGDQDNSTGGQRCPLGFSLPIHLASPIPGHSVCPFL